jgi:Polyphosphate kinase 2 (PPK2)
LHFDHSLAVISITVLCDLNGSSTLRGDQFATGLAPLDCGWVTASLKLSQLATTDMDLESFRRWYDYSAARDIMLKTTDSKHAPWHIIRSDDKKRARLNCIAHLLSKIPYGKAPRKKVKLPPRDNRKRYNDQTSLKGRHFIPEVY